MSWIQWTRKIPNEAKYRRMISDGWGAEAVINRKVCYFIPGEGGILVFILDTEDFSWETEQLPERSRPKLETLTCVVGAHGHKAYLCSEYIDADSLDCFDMETRRWTRVGVSGDVPPCEGFRAACTVNGTMFVFKPYGARRSERRMQFYARDGRLPRDIHALDLSTMVWRKLGGYWPPNCFSDKLVAVGNRLYVLLMEIGKKSESLFVEYYDTVSNTWVTPPRNSPASNVQTAEVEYLYSAIVYDDHIFVTPINNRGMLGTVLKYSVQRNEWEKVFMDFPENVSIVSVVDTRAFYVSFSTEHSWRLSVWDFQGTTPVPTLRSLCMEEIDYNELDTTQLPAALQKDMEMFLWEYGDTDEDDDEDEDDYW